MLEELTANQTATAPGEQSISSGSGGATRPGFVGSGDLNGKPESLPFFFRYGQVIQCPLSTHPRHSSQFPIVGWEEVTSKAGTGPKHLPQATSWKHVSANFGSSLGKPHFIERPQA